MARRSIGKALGLLLLTSGLLAGLPGCTQLIGPVEVGPEVTLEAVPISVPAGESVQFYVSARARQGRKIEIFFLSFGDGNMFVSDPMAVISIDRYKISHVYMVPDGVDVMEFTASLRVYDDARNRGSDWVVITVGRGRP